MCRASPRGWRARLHVSCSASAHARAPPVARERFALLSVSHERPVTDFLAPKNTRARVYGVGPKVAGSGCPAVRRRIES